MKIWEVGTGNRLDTFGQPLKEQQAVAFSPDGRHVAAGGVDNRIRIWQLSETAAEGTNPLVLTRFAHEGAIIGLAWSRNGRTIVSSADDRTVRVWDAEQVVERRSLPAQPDWPAALALAGDGQTLLVGRLDGSFALYNAESGDIVPPPKPELAALSPRGVRRGEPTRIKLTGKNLLEASEVKFNQPGLSGRVVAEPAGESAGGRSDTTWIEVTPAADLPRGAYQVAIATPGGTSGWLAIEVDDLAQLSETEPNNSAASAPAVELPAGVWGVLAERGDIDHVRFTARAGQTIVCELAAKRLGSPLNGVLTLLDPKGEVVAGNNDFDGQEDPLVAYRVPADGEYTLRISDLGAERLGQARLSALDWRIALCNGVLFR